MATVQPKGETLRQAVRWISEQLEEDPDRKRSGLIQEACARFNLTPKDEVYLISFYKPEDA
mgnify:FL=1